jgi:predicted transposase YdaD
MADTDSPLKQLVESCILDFAAWLLNAEVQEAHAVNVELTGRSVRVDQLYRVALVNRRDVLLHIEFQGVNSHEPMPLRMLDYMARLVRLDTELDLCSVVIYVGRGAGANDTGEHQINSADDRPSLTWRYQVIRLWQMRAEELLALQRPALLPLVGQTQIDNPGVIIPEVVSTLKTVSDAAL